MARTRNPRPAVFREQLVALHRARRGLEDPEREFEPRAATNREGSKQAERDAGRRADGPRSKAREEPHGVDTHLWRP